MDVIGGTLETHYRLPTPGKAFQDFMDRNFHGSKEKFSSQGS